MSASLANWRTAPHNRWAFHHVRELVPSADIPNDPARVRALPAAPIDLGLERFLEETDTDGAVILHRGRMIYERYAHGMTPETPHILMSVSKSRLGLLMGALDLDPERLAADVMPQLGATAYTGATLRHLLDMRAGVAFTEDYLATSGPIVEYRKATGWNPLAPGDTPSDLRSFLLTLTSSSGPHGGRFDYISPNTDLLGLLIERPTPWLEDIERSGDRAAWAAGSLVEYFPGLPMRYRSQWYVLDGAAPLVFGVGIHGQNLFVDRANRIVIAKLSSQAQPLDAARFGRTMKAVARIRNVLGAG